MLTAGSHSVTDSTTHPLGRMWHLGRPATRRPQRRAVAHDSSEQRPPISAPEYQSGAEGFAVCAPAPREGRVRAFPDCGPDGRVEFEIDGLAGAPVVFRDDSVREAVTDALQDHDALAVRASYDAAFEFLAKEIVDLVLLELIGAVIIVLLVRAPGGQRA